MGIPRRCLPRGGVLDFSLLAFETLGSRHSGSLLECLDSEQKCTGVTVGQGEHNINVQKDDKKNQFSFPGPLHKEIYFSLHSPLQGAKERTQCSGMALIQLFWEAHYLKYVFHPCSTAQSWKVRCSPTHMENGSTNRKRTLKSFGYLADFKQISHTAPYLSLSLVLCAYTFIHKPTTHCVCVSAYV